MILQPEPGTPRVWANMGYGREGSWGLAAGCSWDVQVALRAAGSTLRPLWDDRGAPVRPTQGDREGHWLTQWAEFYFTVAVWHGILCHSQPSLGVL